MEVIGLAESRKGGSEFWDRPEVSEMHALRICHDRIHLAVGV